MFCIAQKIHSDLFSTVQRRQGVLEKHSAQWKNVTELAGRQGLSGLGLGSLGACMCSESGASMRCCLPQSQDPHVQDVSLGTGVVALSGTLSKPLATALLPFP